MSVVYLFGPSCGGKSTLGKALESKLGSRCVYIDRDDLIENGDCDESKADIFLEQKINFIKDGRSSSEGIAASRKIIIVDTQIPYKEKQEGEVYVLVQPPLDVLLARDEERTKTLKRPEKRAFYAREYVIHTFKALDQMEKTKFDHCFDSSQISVQEEVCLIESSLRI